MWAFFSDLRRLGIKSTPLAAVGGCVGGRGCNSSATLGYSAVTTCCLPLLLVAAANKSTFECGKLGRSSGGVRGDCYGTYTTMHKKHSAVLVYNSIRTNSSSIARGRPGIDIPIHVSNFSQACAAASRGLVPMTTIAVLHRIVAVM